MIEESNEQQVHFGAPGSQAFLKRVIKTRNISRILLVSGFNSFEKSGASFWLTPCLTDAYISRFSGFSINPEISDLEKGLEVYRHVNPDMIIAIGGGSAMDMAKLIGFFGTSGLNPNSYLDHKVEKNILKKCVVVAIPTTAGTGSEATHFAVLYKNKIKYSVADKSILPEIVIINPNFSSTMPPYLTACTGMDALAQAIESYWAVNSTKESRKYAEKALSLSLEYLDRAVNQPDTESRAGMAESSYWAGRGINISKTTLCHALSYSITSHFKYPHGHAVALTLPLVLEYNFKSISGKNLQLLLALLGAPDVITAKDQMFALMQQIGLNDKIPASADKIYNILSEGTNPERLKNNPCPLDKDFLFKLSSSIAKND